VTAVDDLTRTLDGCRPAVVAVSAVAHRTGRSYSYQGNLPFQTASVVKVQIVAALLLQAQRAGRGLTGAERALAEAMITASDNAAGSALWRAVGDVAGMADADARLGLADTRPGADGWWGLTMTTADDQARLLTAIADPGGPLRHELSAYVLDLMARVAPDQAWGVSAAAAAGEPVAVKNGWMPRDDQGGRWTVNSVGRVGEVTLAVLSEGHANLRAGIDVVEEIARNVRAHLDR